MQKNGQCVQVKTVYSVHATDHKRGQDDVSMTATVDSIYGLLEIVVELKKAGYRKVGTLQCGRKYFHPATGKEVKVSDYALNAGSMTLALQAHALYAYPMQILRCREKWDM